MVGLVAAILCKVLLDHGSTHLGTCMCIWCTYALVSTSTYVLCSVGQSFNYCIVSL